MHTNVLFCTHRSRKGEKNLIIHVRENMIADDTGTYTIKEAMQILEYRAALERKKKWQVNKWYLAALALSILGILEILVFASEDATAGIVLVFLGFSLAYANKKGGIR